MRGIMICQVFLIAVTAHLAAGQERLAYPVVRRNESVVDNYYGTDVTDPYRHLEELGSEEVKEFVAAQNNLTDEYLGRSPARQTLEEKLTAAYNYPKFGVPARHGSRYIYTMNTGLQDNDVWYAQEGLDGEPRPFFDPNALDPNGTTFVYSMGISSDGELAAICLGYKSVDWFIHVVNVTSGEALPDVLDPAKSVQLLWSKDGLGFFYNYYGETGGFGIYYHRLGTRQDEDVLAVDFSESQLNIADVIMTDDGNHIVLFIYKHFAEKMVYLVPLEEQLSTGGIRFRLAPYPIVDELKDDYSFTAFNGTTLFLKTNNGAPNSRIIAIDLDQPEQINWRTIVPEHENNPLMASVTVAKDKLIVHHLVDVKSQLEVRSLHDGALLQRLELPLGMIETEHLIGRESNDELFFRLESFITPGLIYRVNLTGSAPFQLEIFKEIKVPGFNPDDFVEKQVFYETMDGTMIPMFIVHKVGLELNGNNSAFMHGYGGLGLVWAPTFHPDRAVFLRDFNGVFVVPNLRGGGEYGRGWHDAGKLLNKQNVFDDFHAAAEYIIREGYTSSSKLAIQGRSNGGLLVAAGLTQRPELYGAAIAQVSLLDLLRYQHFTIGATWCGEFGCSDDGNRTTFENLLSYSPPHNVRLPSNPAVQYPPTFVTTADLDITVLPLHSYKLAAELQYTIGGSPRQTNPLLLRVQLDANHLGYLSIAGQIVEYSEIYTFLAEAAGFPFTPGRDVQ